MAGMIEVVKRKRLCAVCGGAVCEAGELCATCIGCLNNSESVLPAPRLMRPRVVRLRRERGVVVQDCDVYIGRRCTMGGWNLPQSKWANPCSVASAGSVAAAVAAFRRHLVASPALTSALAELSGKILGCWCKPGPCHGDVLVEEFLRRFGVLP